MADTQQSPYEESQRGAWLSIAAYILLTAAKLGVGWWSGSKGVVADGVNNLTDVLGSAAVLMGLRIAVRPADEEHRYGHQKSETVAAIIAAAIMGLIGLDVAVTAGKAVFYPNLEVPRPAAIWVGAGSAIIMFGVYYYNIRLARRTGSKALEAAAFDNRSDAYTSLGSVAGIIGAHLGWRWLDPTAGFIIALIILRTAWHIGAGAAHALTDGFDTEALGQIRDRVAATHGVVRINDLRARYLGNSVAVEVTVGVRSSLTIVEAHRVSDEVEQSLLGYLNIGHVHVHVEPVQRKADVQVG